MEIDDVKSAEHCARYLCKYLAKVASGSVAVVQGRAVEPRGEAAALVDGNPVSSSNAHNVDSGSGGVGQASSTGRWWGVWGNLPQAEAREIVADDPAAIAAKVRRVFRKWVQVKARQRMAHKYPFYPSGEHDRMVKREARGTVTRKSSREARARETVDDQGVVISAQRERKSGRWKFLYTSGGFSLLGPPELLLQCLTAAGVSSGASAQVVGMAYSGVNVGEGFPVGKTGWLRGGQRDGHEASGAPRGTAAA